MKTYGLSKYQIQKAKDKLEFNQSYMKDNGVQIDNKIVPFADFVTNSYTNSNRYVAELQHRAWSVYEYAKDRGLQNIFFTLTLPSKWHKLKTFKNRLIPNKKFAGRDYICTINKIKFVNAHVEQNIPFIEPILNFQKTTEFYTPRNASKQLSKMLKKLFDDRSYKNINKQDRCYFRVTEPHKDGTPHIHMSLFVPKDSKESIVKALARIFPAPLGKIETEVNSPVKYLMKYVLKTLDDLREEDSEISNLTLWYLYHGISRFYTSKTFVRLEIYRKLRGMYNLQELTQKYELNEVSVYVYSDTKKIAMIENEYGTIYIPKPINWSKKIDEADELGENGTIDLNSGFESVYKEEKPLPIEVIIDGEDFITYNFLLKEHNNGNRLLNEIGVAPIALTDILVKRTIKPYQMNDYDLYQYFRGLDIDIVDDKHYLNTRNILVDRGYLDCERLKLTAIEDMQIDFEAEGVF